MVTAVIAMVTAVIVMVTAFIVMVTANVYFGACTHHSGFEPGKAQLCSHDNVKKAKPEQGHSKDSLRTDKSKKQN